MNPVIESIERNYQKNSQEVPAFLPVKAKKNACRLLKAS